jgi:hypothetical protein
MNQFSGSTTRQYLNSTEIVSRCFNILAVLVLPNGYAHPDTQASNSPSWGVAVEGTVCRGWSMLGVFCRSSVGNIFSQEPNPDIWSKTNNASRCLCYSLPVLILRGLQFSPQIWLNRKINGPIRKKV